MAKKEPDFENKVKEAFFKVKEDILALKNEIKEIKETLAQQNLNFPQETKGSLRQHYGNITATNMQNLSNKQLKDELEQKFLDLSDTEFLAYIAIYELEDESNRPVSYVEVAEKLKISQSNVRTYISNLYTKGLPIKKIKHKKRGYVSIPKSFRVLGLAGRLVEIRSLYGKGLDDDQRTLFD